MSPELGKRVGRPYVSLFPMFPMFLVDCGNSSFKILAP
jgi:hypothetical protein